ncbi:hypothetical protein A3841_12860 [Pontibacter flavimaris]|uniref:Uncharacterized protein n=2 Tax=Pontibacter flavimaris TaxID=1797110 RepID=A0A1Q5PEU4_9BACT|nr:hypothetical protein A3841_12860 [Pontibacter flavimaris]
MFGTCFALGELNLRKKHMKKLLTIAFMLSFVFAGQAALADSHGNGNGKGKAKGKPSFVDEKHRAHAEWKREKEYEKEYKKRMKKHDDEDRDDDRWNRRREEERRRDDERWERSREEQRRSEETRRRTRNRTLGQVILDEAGRGRTTSN